MTAAVRELLRSAVASLSHFVLFLEDDLRFNRHLRHNLVRWLEDWHAIPERHFFATLFNPSGASIGTKLNRTTFLDAKCAFGGQALLFSSSTARHLLDNWDRCEGLHDFRMSKLAALLGPIYCHSPSLVQHVSVPST